MRDKQIISLHSFNWQMAQLICLLNGIFILPHFQKTALITIFCLHGDFFSLSRFTLRKRDLPAEISYSPSWQIWVMSILWYRSFDDSFRSDGSFYFYPNAAKYWFHDEFWFAFLARRSFFLLLSPSGKQYWNFVNGRHQIANITVQDSNMIGTLEWLYFWCSMKLSRAIWISMKS